MNTALVLIDIQNDYFPGGSMELEGAVEAGEKAALLLDAARESCTPVCHVQHVSLRPDATFFLPGTEGVAIHQSVAPRPGETIVTKNYPNSFRETGLQDFLDANDIHRIIFAGMMTHMCVDATVRAAFDRSYQCAVAPDACATRALEWGGETIPAKVVHGSFLAALSAVYALVLPAGELASTFKQCGPLR